MATNRFLCEICGKGFQRDQNLQLHRRGHNLPWKLKQRTSKEPRKRVYVCPEKSCVHHHPSRALGDLTGIKKHFCRKHGEKKWKCEKCNKKYAVQSDWKAHSKTCGTREYKCDCGTIFSRRDSFITHRAFCDALAEETARMNAASTHFNLNAAVASNNNLNYHHMMGSNIGPAVAMAQHFSSIFRPLSSSTKDEIALDQHQNQRGGVFPLWLGNQLTQPGGGIHHQTSPNNSSHIMSATALLYKAAQMGSTSSTNTNDAFFDGNFGLVKENNNEIDHNNFNRSGSVFGTSNSTTTNAGSDVEGSVDDLSTMTTMYTPNPAKRQKLVNDHVDSHTQRGVGVGSGGQTRDFLGVGSQPAAVCQQPSSVNGWI
uniref:C2H2-type domain-containing protein n=2 Tax=Chenopodium quinoa TaxID=63459 RepID=A0A803MVY8_CHEQI